MTDTSDPIGNHLVIKAVIGVLYVCVQISEACFCFLVNNFNECAFWMQMNNIIPY